MPTCTWFKEQNIVEESSRHKVEVQQVKEGEYAVKLEISQVVETDKGSYKVIARNEKGEAVSQIVELQDLPDEEERTQVKPNIKRHLKNETFEETRTFELYVQLEKTDKKCTVKWFKNSSIISESHTYKKTFDGKVATLRISKAKSTEHNATFKCVIQNELGADESTAEITIKKVEDKKKEEEEEKVEEELQKIEEEETTEETKEKTKKDSKKKEEKTEKTETIEEKAESKKKKEEEKVIICRSFFFYYLRFFFWS